MKNRDVISAAVGIAAAFVLCMGAPSMSVKADTPLNGWYEENGAKYWYENGVRQGPRDVARKFMIQVPMRGTGWMLQTTARWL